METTPRRNDATSAAQHVHGPSCGHVAIRHEDHIDYLQDGHLQNVSRLGAIAEHVIPVSRANPNECTPQHQCAGHQQGHVHNADCGHQRVPHGDHVDYLVDGHLHHPHGTHCDAHGAVALDSR